MIQHFDQTIEKQVKIKLITTDHKETHQFTNVSAQLTNMTSHIVIESKKGETPLPGFLLTENITYSALPLEKELEPFLEALLKINSADPGLSAPAISRSIGQPLDQIDIPVRLKLYIALQCPHCPNMVRTLISMALYCDQITLHIIDGRLFSETAQQDKVMSAPCLILDDDFRWTGAVSMEEIAQMILRRDPSQLSVNTLRTILEQGDILYALGEAGNGETKEWLKKKLPRLAHQDLIDAAGEAIDRLESKTEQENAGESGCSH